MTKPTIFSILKASFGFLILSLNYSTSYAEVNTHKWSEHHRGYSIELVPGTGDNTGQPAEYVAAGTVFDNWNRPGEAGWHFMHLDNNGNILSSRIAWPQSMIHHEFRVVDIAAAGANDFRILIQARGSDDYIHIQGVDVNGNDLPTNSKISISAIFPSTYEHLYPTHSYYSNGHLYICGYATRNTAYHAIPDNYYTDKIGMVLKVQLNTSSPIPTAQFWNSTGTGNTDFDMPLRLAPGSFHNEFPLLLTGALNDGNGLSAALVSKIGQACNIVAQNGIQFNYGPLQPGGERGIYGVDMRGGIGNYEEEFQDHAILVNFFAGHKPFRKTWGVIRLDASLHSYPSAVNSCLLLNGNNSWANQFLNLHTMNGGGERIQVVGQEIEPYDIDCMSPLPSGTKIPSLANVNPFIADVLLGDPYFKNPAQPLGYVFGPSHIYQRYMYLSENRMGTRAALMDYLSGNFGDGPALEDVSRLYTFTSISRFYDEPNGHAPYMIPSMIVPVAEDPTYLVSSRFLLTKFLGLRPTPLPFNEPTCLKHRSDCMEQHNNVGTTRDVGEILPVSGMVLSAFTDDAIFELENNWYIPQHFSCTTGYYKPSDIDDINEKSGEINIYPNPASSLINIALPTIVKTSDHFVFSMSDVTGKEVYQTNKAEAGKTTVQITLPALSSGTYFISVTFNSMQYNKHIVIE